MDPLQVLGAYKIDMNHHRYLKEFVKVGLDLVVLSLTFYLAYVLRFEGVVSRQDASVLLSALPALLGVAMLCFFVFGVRRLTWRYISLKETGLLFLSLSFATVLLLAWNLAGAPFDLVKPLAVDRVPRSVFLINLPLAFLGVTALRVFFRVLLERHAHSSAQENPSAEGVPSLVIGTGRTGALMAREISAGRAVGIRGVGLVTKASHYVGQTIHGLPVIGTIDALADILPLSGAAQVLIALDNTSRRDVCQIVEVCKKHGIQAKYIPNMQEVMEGRMNMASTRDVMIEDLLRRRPVVLDVEAIAKVVHDKVVLVSGAGGSIGSELCRWACRYRPKALLLVERAENSLFLIHQELTRTFPGVPLVPCVADVCDEERLREIFIAHRPAVVFHAAAHKHVPMMEWNPGEAVKNNVLGTKNLADISDEARVEKFVMISTDKAINPTSVMGVSKRVAEMYVQSMNERSRTRFVAVRFGNVLGSNGSVVPIFKEQIARGGPVTVTHPEMRRYFMTIPEACQLVMQAAAMGEGGEIFVLDMGEQVKILDLAQDLIRLSGLIPGEDIEIHFTGMRPGEKLYEELCLHDENADKTKHPQIFVGRLRPEQWNDINRKVFELGSLAGEGEADAICHKFKDIVKEYRGTRVLKGRGDAAVLRHGVDHIAKPPKVRL